MSLAVSMPSYETSNSLWLIMLFLYARLAILEIGPCHSVGLAYRSSPAYDADGSRSSDGFSPSSPSVDCFSCLLPRSFWSSEADLVKLPK